MPEIGTGPLARSGAGPGGAPGAAARPAALPAIVALCFAMAVVAWGTVFYGYSFYLQALVARGGFSTVEVSTAIGVGFWAGIPASLVLGQWLRRHGPLGVVVAGAAALGTGLALLPHVDSLPALHAVFALLGAAYPCLATPGISAILNVHVHERYAARLGTALTGASVGGATVVPVMVLLESRLGLGVTMAAVGITSAALLMWAAALLLRAAPAASALPAGEAAPASVRMALRSRAYLLVVGGSALALGAQVGLLTHQIPALALHLDPTAAALGVSITAAFAVAGRLAVGALAPRVTLHRLAAACALVQAGGLALLAGATAPGTLYAACAVTGSVVGAIVMLPALLIRDRFGARDYAQLYALANAALYLAAGLGPMLTGALREASGDYTLALLALALVQGIAALVLGGSGRLASY